MTDRPTPERGRRGPRALLADRRGNMAVVFGLALPVILGTVGAAVDFSQMSDQRVKLQGAADAAALAAARDFQVAAANPVRARAVADSIARSHLQDEPGGYTLASAILQNGTGIRVTVEQPAQPRFVHLLGIEPKAIQASATAKLVGSRRMCVLAFDDANQNAVFTDSNSLVSAPTCDVNSRSAHAQGVGVRSNSTLDAMLTCSANGIHRDGGATIRGSQVQKCKVPDDPLRDRREPVVGPCTQTEAFEVKPNAQFADKKNSSETNRFPIKPGVYCKGLKIPSGWHVRFEPGIYVVKDGDLVIDGDTNTLGEDVLFFLTGEKALIDFKGNARIHLSGRRSGDWAGILFFEERAAQAKKVHKMTAEFAEKLVGTIYLPGSTLEMDFKAKIGQHSAFTVLLVRQLVVKGESQVVLNTNYHLTDVPAPPDVSGKAGTVLLSE